MKRFNLFVLAGIGLLFDFCSPAAAKRRNGLCDPREFFDEVPGKPQSYMQCTPKVKQVGEWEELECPEGHKFQKRLQKCLSKEAMKRQYISPNCNGNPFGTDCPSANLFQPPVNNCPANNANPAIGNQCAWVSASLQPDPTSQNYFLQCTPENQGAACGSWQRMACTAGSAFNPQLQVCVTENLQRNSACQPNYQPIVPCGFQSQCPTTCSCYVGTCCQPYQPVNPIPNPPVPAPPQNFCPNGQPAIASCIGTGPSTCPLNYQCVNSGCCILPLPTCPNGQTAISPCLIGGSQQCQPPYTCINGGCCQQPLPQCLNGATAIQACMGIGPTSCPAGYVCQNGACCQASCADGSIPNQSCPTGLCPPGFQCQNGACCRIPMPTCPNGQLAAQACPGTGQSTCRMGYYCVNGGCCLLPQCPNGQPALQVCSAGGVCPGGLVCQNGGCCQPPLPNCPNGVIASGLCNGPGTCPANQYCYNQGCCSIPTCPTGQFAVQPCGIQGFQCSSGYQCVNGGCCPLPLPICVNGQQATQTCAGPGTCPNNDYCFQDPSGNQGCCPVPRCSNGAAAVAPCFGGTPCPQGFVCQNGGCCQLPMCPNGQSGIQSCTGPGTCPTGTTCQNSVCCQIPICPNGQQSVQMCNSLGQCPSGYACQNGGCCPIPTCPNGVPAVQSCVGTGQANCPIGYQCSNGGCCAVQLTLTCPYGGTSVQACGPGSTCPAPYTCYQGQCCPPPPLPICPNGQRASQTCSITGGFGGPTSCPPYYQCYNGGCCPMQNTNPVNPTCPQVQQPICLCATFNSACPQSTSCYGGTCCASNQSPFYNTVRPGDRCPDGGAACPGLSQCVNGYCVCSGNSRSNGVSCVAYAAHKEKKNKKIRRFDPSESCGQFGAECDKYEKIEKTEGGKIRRRAPTMRDLGIQNNTKPIFWYTFSPSDHFCKSNDDCTPDMTCIKRKCYSYVMPGEEGCKLDEQCNRTCTGSLCLEDKAHNTTLCQCEPGRALYAKKCWQECPSHTKAQGGTCIPVKMEKTGVKGFAKRILGLFSKKSV